MVQLWIFYFISQSAANISSIYSVLVKARADENCLIQSFGLYLGARVVRGYNWKAEWGNQDGGAGKQGTIVAFR